jgi:DNA polymerase IV
MIICILLSDFVVALERQLRPELAASPLAVMTSKSNRQLVYAFSGEVKQAGVTLGMGKSRVRALCPEAVITQATPKRYQSLAEQLCDKLLIVTDRIEYEQNHALAIWLDVGTLSQEALHTLLSCARDTVEQQVAAKLHIGVSNGRSTARIAASTVHPGGIRWLATGQERELLLPLPLRSFALPSKLAEQFDGLGLDRLSDLAQLPYNAVRTRFGDVGAQLHRLAHGHDRSQLNRYQQQERIVASYPFDSPVNEVGVLEAVIVELARFGAAQQAQRNLLCGEVVLTLECDNKKRLELARTVREPIQNQQAIREELSRLLTQAKLESGVTQLTMVLDRLAAPKPVQMDFFGMMFSEPEAMVVTLAEQLIPRHGEEIFSRISVSPEPSYLLERNVTFERVAAA